MNLFLLAALVCSAIMIAESLQQRGALRQEAYPEGK